MRNIIVSFSMRIALATFATVGVPSSSAFVLPQLRKSAIFSITRAATSLTDNTSNSGRNSNFQINDAFLSELNDSQRLAVTAPTRGILRVIAGPGAGKTRVLTSRIAWLLLQQEIREDGCDNAKEKRILAVTFTKKAAGEMQSRLEAIMTQCCTITDEEEKERIKRRRMNQVTLGTFHSVCARILRRHSDEFRELPGIKASNLDSSFAIIDQAEQIAILKKCLNDCGGIDLNNEGIKPKQILDEISKMKSSAEENEIIKQQKNYKNNVNNKAARIQKLAKTVFSSYCSTLLESNCLDFDDLILYTRDLLRHNSQVRDTLRDRWTHILVDEFQDTSQIQLELIQTLTTSSLLVVGDSDQSIYSWRGADVKSMSDFANQFSSSSPKQQQVQTFYLMENYRSTSNIVQAAQRVISDNEAPDRTDMIPMRGSGKNPRVLACKDSKTEASFVVKTILDNTEVYTPSSTIAIIYRTNAQSRAIEEECVAQNLRYLVRGSAGKFYNRAEIKDCLCFLRLIYNGRDKTAFIRATKTPSRGIGEVALTEFFEYYEKVIAVIDQEKDSTSKSLLPSILEVLLSLLKDEDASTSKHRVFESPICPLPEDTISKRALSRFVPFAKSMKTISELATNQTVSSLLNSTIEIFGLEKHFDSISLSNEEFRDKWGNVMELINAANRYTKDGPSMFQKSEAIDELEGHLSPLGSFIDDVALLSDLAESDNNSDDDVRDKPGARVTANLMTIHASKGMEFDAVFLIGNEEGTFPTQRAIAAGKGSIELEEERRLCFVAMTRAKTNLILTWRKSVDVFRGQGGGVSTISTDRSRFLNALVNSKGSIGSNDSKADHKLSSSPQSSKNMLPQRTSTRVQSNSKNSERSHNHSPQRTASAHEQTKRHPQKVERRNVEENHILSRTDLIKRRQERSSQDDDLSSFSRKVDAIGEFPSMDVTLIYPIGSKVVHTIHGDGVIVSKEHNTSSERSDSVSVKFVSGLCIEFPTENNGLRFIYN